MTDPQLLRSRALRANFTFAIVLALLVLVPAWSLHYWQGFLLWAHFCAWCTGLTLYFLKHDPALAERRMAAGSQAEELVPLLLLGLVMRLTDEERHLTKHLEGYADYRREVHHRLVPGIW